MTQFMLPNDLRFFCRKAASFNRRLQQQSPFAVLCHLKSWETSGTWQQQEENDDQEHEKRVNDPFVLCQS
jgi:hypothetical protein